MPANKALFDGNRWRAERPPRNLAAPYQVAFELGGRLERDRIAQDLHDDLGARLLSLLLRCQDPQLREELRSALKDVKTLARALSGGPLFLRVLSSEWRAEAQRRLDCAGIELVCQGLFAAREMPELEIGPTHWSAMARILRELISNIIAHANARRVHIELALEPDTRGKAAHLRLRVQDDGHGADWAARDGADGLPTLPPEGGLGIAGICKRASGLGGVAHWERATPTGLRCEVVIPLEMAGQDAGAN